ncbi:hypothetical protein HanIR_Chr12g0607111 [Helianthus annuus]|nr:hypothetical protein HanIR_Chr12g0607111 [Helianthus annuus]
MGCPLIFGLAPPLVYTMASKAKLAFHEDTDYFELVTNVYKGLAINCSSARTVMDMNARCDGLLFMVFLLIC